MYTIRSYVSWKRENEPVASEDTPEGIVVFYAAPYTNKYVDLTRKFIKNRYSISAETTQEETEDV